MMFRKPIMNDTTGSLVADSMGSVSVETSYKPYSSVKMAWLLQFEISYQILSDAATFFYSPASMKKHLEKNLKDLLETKSTEFPADRMSEDQVKDWIINPIIKKADELFLQCGISILRYSSKSTCTSDHSYHRCSYSSSVKLRERVKIEPRTKDQSTQTDPVEEIKSTVGVKVI